MIYAKDALEIACLKQPDMLVELTRAEFERTLIAFEHAEWADSYTMEHAPLPALVPRSRTLFATLVGVMRMGLAEWPSSLAALLALMLRTKTSVPSEATLARWEAMRQDGAFKHLTPVLIRAIEKAMTGLKNAGMFPEKFSAWRQSQHPELTKWAANPDVWSAGKALFTSALWLLSFDTEPKARLYLVRLCESESWVRHDCATTLYWALARPADDRALKILKGLMTASLDARRRHALMHRIGEIEGYRQAEAPLEESDADKRAGWKLDSLVTSGYEIVANEARSLLALRDAAGLHELVDLLSSADRSKPSTVWLAKRDRVFGRIDGPALREALVGVVDAYNAITVVRPILSMQEFEALEYLRKTGGEQPGNPAARGIAERERERARVFGTFVPGIKLLSETAAALARGAHWTLAAMPDAELADLWYRTVAAWARMGDPNPTIAYAAMHALSATDPDLVLPRLQELRLRIRHKNLTKRIAAAFEAVAKARGLSSEDLADELVSDHELDPDGARTWTVGGWLVRLRIGDDGSTAMSYVDPSGKERKSLPKAAASADPEAVKDAKSERKALTATLFLQTGRLESAMIDGRRWTAASLERTFGRHPVLSRLACRLVWRIEGPGAAPELAMHRDAEWRDIDGRAVTVGGDDRISLPHAAELNDPTLERWRSALIESKIVQPFKQMFRETYRPSDDEQQRLDCARFTGLVVPLNTVRALLAPRGWSGGFGLSGFDGSGQGERIFAPYGVRAFLHHGDDDEFRNAHLEAIEFYRQPGHERIPVGEVPLVPFSEALRDIDLVASAAIGTIAETGVLDSVQTAIASATGLMRGPLVRQVVDGLGLGDRVAFYGSFAVVDGRFSVHLGTGLITRLGKNESVHLPYDASTLRGIHLPFEIGDDPIARQVATIVRLTQRPIA
ncbi:MAG TPA: DUF4132 domain-containing protein [Candidatus Eremiobacteraceae bacterium]|jgi:hypothetical protein